MEKSKLADKTKLSVQLDIDTTSLERKLDNLERQIDRIKEKLDQVQTMKNSVTLTPQINMPTSCTVEEVVKEFERVLQDGIKNMDKGLYT